MLATVLTHLVNRHDARMIQIGSRFRFGVESADIFVTRQLTSQNHFQCHQPIQSNLPGFVDDAHPSTGDLFEQLVVTKVVDSGADLPRAVRCWCSLPLERLSWWQCHVFGRRSIRPGQQRWIRGLAH